ncbi:MAG: ABC transporter permease subunit, partial [Pseudomonadota bacterium]|nr:ABC transporter permease subunit [Pseudomonadota bacterium]
MAVDEAGRLPVIRAEEPAKAAFLNDPRTRGILVQIVLIVALVAFAGWIINNTAENLQRANVASGYGFLAERAGFEIGQSPVPYSPDRSYGYAIYVGFLNTLVVAAIGIVAASIIGFLVGIGRLSKNWLIRQLSTVYVEVFRNIPPLLVILFWYFGVIAVLPAPRDAIDTGLGITFSNRGAIMPRLLLEEGSWLIFAALFVAVVAVIGIARWAKARQMATGQRFPLLRWALALLIGLPLIAYFAAGQPLGVE